MEIIYSLDELHAFIKRCYEQNITLNEFSYGMKEVEEMYQQMGQLFDYLDDLYLQYQSFIETKELYIKYTTEFTKYHMYWANLVVSLMQSVFEFDIATEEEMQVITYILNSDFLNHIEGYPEPTEEEIESFIDILNTEEVEESRVYESDILNSLSFAWKYAVSQMNDYAIQEKEEKRMNLLLKILITGVFSVPVIDQIYQEDYVRAIAGMTLIYMNLKIFHAMENQEDFDKSLQEISTLSNWAIPFSFIYQGILLPIVYFSMSHYCKKVKEKTKK